MDLSHYSERDLVTLGKALRPSGTFGKDHCQMTKAEKVAYIATLASHNRILVTIEALGLKRTSNGAFAGPEPSHTNGSTANVAPEKGPDTMPETHTNGEGAALAAIIRDIAATVKAQSIDAEQVQAIVAQALEAQSEEQAAKLALVIEDLRRRTPREVTLKVGDLPAVALTGKHPAFGKLLALASLPANVRPKAILLVGPSGSGKTTMGRHLSEALRRDFAALSLSAGTHEGKLEGRVLPLGEGRYVYSESARIYENGGVILWDELDAMAPEIGVVINSATANGAWHIENRAVSGLPVEVQRHPDTVLLAAANTYGTGADSVYVGRTQMDGATLDRFLVLHIGHDKALWARACGVAEPEQAPWEPVSRTHEQVNEALAELHAFWEHVEERVTTLSLRRVISYRGIEKGIACIAAGFSMQETKSILLAGWSKDDRAKVGA